MIFKMIL